MLSAFFQHVAGIFQACDKRIGGIRAYLTISYPRLGAKFPLAIFFSEIRW